MDHLYTPWRMAYLRGERTPNSGCVFCEAPEQSDEEALIVARGQRVYAILNAFPYNSGHLMIIPYAHVGSLEALVPDALAELMTFTQRAIAALRKLYAPSGFNIGANIGSAAGAGIAEHFHLHIVPRWNGDANFITTIGDTRVLPDLLANTHRQLRQTWIDLFGMENS